MYLQILKIKYKEMFIAWKLTKLKTIADICVEKIG